MQDRQLIIVLLITGVILVFVHTCLDRNVFRSVDPDKMSSKETVDADALTPPNLRFGIDADSLIIVEGRVQRNQTLSHILGNHNISSSVIHQIANLPREIFDVRRIRQGNNYKVFVSNDTLSLPQYFVYQFNPVEYIRIDLNDPIKVQRDAKEVERVLKGVSGTINSSLWNAMTSNQAPPVLAIELSEIYAWTVDFFGLSRGDNFRIYFEENYINSEPIGVNRVVAASFTHRGREIYAIPFEQDSVTSFFDQEGNSLRRTFLRAPLRYSRISSGFSHSRMHPIHRVRRPHLGVDYAAPAGTPVYAIGDGRIIETSYSAGPGNMVRIRHNSVYTTGYMHLRNFATGIRPGVWVQQGDVIGYVGSTGTSTGPHLDFRVWRNGHPVDPLTIESPPVEPVKEENIAEFERIREYWKSELSRLTLAGE